YPTGRLSHKGNLVPIRFREISGSIEIMSSGCGITAVPVHLTKERSKVRHIIVRINATNRIAGTTDHRSLQEIAGHRQIGAVLAIGSGDKDVEIFGKAQSPGIVAGRAEKL